MYCVTPVKKYTYMRKLQKKNHESVFIFSEFQGEVGRRRNKIGIGSAFQLVSRTILMNNNNRTNFK